MIFEPSSAPEFNLLGDNVYSDKGNNSNAWVTLSTGTGASDAVITIPVGIFNVSSVSTMLNTIGGVTTGGTICAGATDASTAGTCSNTNSYSYITLEFNQNDPTGVSGTDLYETIAIVNGVTQRNILDGTCVTGTNSNLYCNGTGALASQISNSTVTDPFNSAVYGVTAQNVFTTTTSDQLNANSPANGTTMVLDAQTFPVFQEYGGDYLVSVSITNTGNSSGANYSEEVLSGLTVNAAPEPSTIGMFLGGFGAMGFGLLRRKRS
jgi:hypothetical protein